MVAIPRTGFDINDDAYLCTFGAESTSTQTEESGLCEDPEARREK
jgi:hypothetical protein